MEFGPPAKKIEVRDAASLQAAMTKALTSAKLLAKLNKKVVVKPGGSLDFAKAVVNGHEASIWLQSRIEYEMVFTVDGTDFAEHVDVSEYMYTPNTLIGVAQEMIQKHATDAVDAAMEPPEDEEHVEEE